MEAGPETLGTPRNPVDNRTFDADRKCQRHVSPALNDGEPAILHCLVIIYRAAAGGGAWPVNTARGKAVGSSRPKSQQRDAASSDRRIAFAIACEFQADDARQIEQEARRQLGLRSDQFIERLLAQTDHARLFRRHHIGSAVDAQ